MYILLLLLLLLFIIKTLNRYKSNSIYLGTLSFQIRLESCLNNQKCECQVQDCFKRLAVPANIKVTTCHSCKPALVYSGSCRARLGGWKESIDTSSASRLLQVMSIQTEETANISDLAQSIGKWIREKS